MRTIDWFKSRSTLINENMKISKGKFKAENKLKEVTDKLANISIKYVDLLEQKSEQFNLYIKYQNQCVELATEKKELKKQLAISNETCDELTKKIEKLERKIKRLEKQSEKSNVE